MFEMSETTFEMIFLISNVVSAYAEGFYECGEMPLSTSGKSASVSYGEIISAALVCEDINEWSSCIDLLEVSWEYKSSIWLCVKLAGNTKSAM